MALLIQRLIKENNFRIHLELPTDISLLTEEYILYVLEVFKG
jgi:hypothetical protein